MKVIYWSDYACPYCYIGEQRLRKAAKALGLELELEMKAFQLDPGADVVCHGETLDRFAKKYGLSKEAAMQRIEQISVLGRAEGIDFKYATTRFTNTMDAHRLTKYVQDKYPKYADVLIEKLYRAYFCDNQELADHDVLLGIAEACGLKREDIQSVLESDRYKDVVLAEELEASSSDIHAVPLFIINDRYVLNGAQPYEVMKSVLERARKDMADVQTVHGMVCGPDGCYIGK